MGKTISHAERQPGETGCPAEWNRHRGTLPQNFLPLWIVAAWKLLTEEQTGQLQCALRPGDPRLEDKVIIYDIIYKIVLLLSLVRSLSLINCSFHC